MLQESGGGGIKGISFFRSSDSTPSSLKKETQSQKQNCFPKWLHRMTLTYHAAHCSSEIVSHVFRKKKQTTKQQTNAVHQFSQDNTKQPAESWQFSVQVDSMNTVGTS